MAEKTPALLVAVAAFFASSVASADVAPPRPSELECVRGAVATLPTVRPDAVDFRGRPVQPWPYCAPSSCASDADCAEGRVCSPEEIGLCVEDHEVEGGDVVRAARERSCEPDGTCLNLHAACERARRCVDAAAAVEPAPIVEPTVPPPPPPPPPPADVVPAPDASVGCGCRAGAAVGGGWLTMVPLLALFLVRRARR